MVPPLLLLFSARGLVGMITELLRLRLPPVNPVSGSRLKGETIIRPKPELPPSSVRCQWFTNYNSPSLPITLHGYRNRPSASSTTAEPATGLLSPRCNPFGSVPLGPSHVERIPRYTSRLLLRDSYSFHKMKFLLPEKKYFQSSQIVVRAPRLAEEKSR